MTVSPQPAKIHRGPSPVIISGSCSVFVEFHFALYSSFLIIFPGVPSVSLSFPPDFWKHSLWKTQKSVFIFEWENRFSLFLLQRNSASLGCSFLYPFYSTCSQLTVFFSFCLLTLGVNTADHLPLSYPIPAILLSAYPPHTNPLHILLHYFS